MKVRHALLASALIPLGVAHAQTTGPYISLGGGANFMTHTEEKQAYSGVLLPNPGFPINVGLPGTSTANKVGPTHYGTGPGFYGAIGYGLPYDFRMELEGSYSYNHVLALNNGITSTGLGTDPLGLKYRGYEKKASIFFNLFYDMEPVKTALGLPFTPYLGAGVGATNVDWSGVTRYSYGGEDFTGAGLGILSSISNAFHTNDWTLSFQGIVGVSYDIPGIPGLAATFDFRYIDLPNGFTQHSLLTLNFRPTPKPLYTTIIGPTAHSNWGEDHNFGLNVGLRYTFNAPAAPVKSAPVPVASPAPVPTRVYLVFFDWDRAELTDRARQIVAEAAQASTRVQYTRIDVQGNADRSGTPAYNQRLSLRRAETVAAELVRDGVPRTAIDIQAFGDTHPLVPTAAGVREPQNRRVEIVLK